MQFLYKNLLLVIQAYQKKREENLISEVEASIIYKIFGKLASESLQTNYVSTLIAGIFF